MTFNEIRRGRETMTQKSDDELLNDANRSGPWLSQDGLAPTLNAALLRAAEISGRGQSPYPLEGPNGERIEHEQMLRLWRRLKIEPPRKPA
jgi:hypothetical protein